MREARIFFIGWLLAGLAFQYMLWGEPWPAPRVAAGMAALFAGFGLVQGGLSILQARLQERGQQEAGEPLRQVTSRELARLQRIEAAARAHVAAWDGGDTMAHETRASLRAALEGDDAPTAV